jgi:hypothetical protein
MKRLPVLLLAFTFLIGMPSFALADDPAGKESHGEEQGKGKGVETQSMEKKEQKKEMMGEKKADKKEMKKGKKEKK